jgi:hypothetical protein
MRQTERRAVIGSEARTISTYDEGIAQFARHFDDSPKTLGMAEGDDRAEVLFGHFS